MQGNGRIISFMAVLTVIVVLIVLNATLFTVKEITVLNKVYSGLIVPEDIINSSNIQTGGNIFVLSERKAIAGIELANPYVKITSIERRFPDKVIIHATVRTAVMAIGIVDSEEYALLDSDLKVLERVDKYSRLYGAATKITGILASSPIIGSTLNADNPNNAVLKTLGDIADNESLDGAAFLTFFESIAFISGAESDNIHIKINSGVTFALSSGAGIETQLRVCLEKYRRTDELSSERKSGYYRYVAGTGWDWSASLPD